MLFSCNSSLMALPAPPLTVLSSIEISNLELFAISMIRALSKG